MFFFFIQYCDFNLVDKFLPKKSFHDIVKILQELMSCIKIWLEGFYKYGCQGVIFLYNQIKLSIKWSNVKKISSV